MPLQIPEALKRMDAAGRMANGRSGAILKSVVETNALFALIPFIETDRPSFDLVREGELPTGGAFIADDDTGPIEESTGTDDVATVQLRRVVGDLDVDSLVDDFSKGTQRTAQLLKKVKATALQVQDKLVNGGHTTGFSIPSAPASLSAITGITEYSPWLDSKRKGPGSIKYVHATTTWHFRAPGDLDYGAGVVAAADGTFTLESWNKSYWIKATIDVSVAVANAEGVIVFTSTTKEFDGVKRLVKPSMVIDPTGTDGDFFSLAQLDKMITNLKVKSNRAFFMNSTYIELYYAIMRSLGGADPKTIMVEGYGEPVPTYRGIPLLETDHANVDETVGSGTTGSLYLASLDAEQGLAFAAANIGTTFDPQSDPTRGPVLGWRVENIGALEGKDARRTRLAFYGAPVLQSPLALVRRRGVLPTLS